jgi:hypothetical protein
MFFALTPPFLLQRNPARYGVCDDHDRVHPYWGVSERIASLQNAACYTRRLAEYHVPQEVLQSYFEDDR